MITAETAQDRARQKLRAKAMGQRRDEKGRFVLSPEYVVSKPVSVRFLGNVERDPFMFEGQHPADAISARPQTGAVCTNCQRAKLPDAWLYCDDCAGLRDNEFDAAQAQADKELSDMAVRVLAVSAVVALVAGVLLIGVFL